MNNITDFQDNFAEQGFSIFGKLQIGEFIAEQSYSQTTPEALKELLVILMEAKATLIDDINFCSLSALTDDMVGKVHKFMTISTYK